MSSRPSSHHAASHSVNDDFALPLFQQPSQAPAPAHPQSYHIHPAAANPSVPSPRSPAHNNGFAHPPAPPPQSQHQQRHSLHIGTLLTPSSSSPYSAQPYSATSESASTPNGTRQQQAMHFPAYSPSTATYGDDRGMAHPSHHQSSHSTGGGGGGALGSLARSASLSTSRRKDPFSYPSDDVESGMAGAGDWGSGQASGGARGYGAPPPSGVTPTQMHGGAPSQMPQSPYLNTNIRDQDIVMSPGGASNSRYQQQHQPSSAMPPPPLPHARLAPSSPSAASMQQQQPQLSNPYVPRDAPPSDSWLNYRHSSARQSHSPQSGSVSPALIASPHSPMQQDTSPHLLTPQGGLQNLPASPRQGSGAPSSPFFHPPPPTHRSHSQSFTASQPATPSGRYDAPSSRASSGRDVRPTSRQGLRSVREPSDLRPIVNTHPKGRRADPNVPGAYLSCLTSALPQTYSLCNPAFKYESSDNPRRVLTKPSKPVYNDGADNEDWDYILYVNDVLGGEHGGDRYLILDVLGQGTFGQVVKCQNMRTHSICAVKVVKNKPAYLNQSKMEVAILNLLNRDHDPQDQHHILRLLDSFTHKNHLCLVFECLSSNLYELIKQNQFKGLSLQLVRVFTQQLLDCLAVLKEARLIHCDLKPENILLKSLQSPQIKVIDFGSACHELQTVYTYIQSRFYRSPEVLLGLPYSTSIDMWSLGCIVVELFLGLPIFPGTSEYNQVSRIVDMLGLPPGHLLEMGKQTNEFFNYVGVDSHGRKQYKLKPMEQYASEHRTKEQPSKQYFKQTQLPDIIMEYPTTKKHAKQSDIDKEMAQRRAFVNFVEGLLNLDPIKRWSPHQAAKHPFITGERYTGPFEPPSVPSKRSTTSSAAPSSTTTAAPTTPTASKKYGGLVQSPPSGRGQRVYSDAAAYNHQLTQHQYQTAQAHAQAQAARQGPFGTPASYDSQQQQQPQYNKGRVVSQQHAPPPSWHQSMPPQPPQPYHPRVPSGSGSQPQQHARPNIPVINAPTNPPPNSYFPASRNRANTINQMDTIPPALARLTNLGAPDPSNRSSLTPVLHREDMAEAWERRQQGGHKPSTLQHQTYAQLEYLQEQAELVNMSQQGYVMPGHYQGPPGHHTSGAAQASLGHHRGTQSFSGTQAYQMQPPIGMSPGSLDFRGRVPPLQLQGLDSPAPGLSAGPSSASGGSSYLPAFPPPAATTQPSSAAFDAFDNRDAMSGLMYTPLQPTQQAAASYTSFSPGHAARSSFSGPYGSPATATQQQQQQQQQQQPRNPFQAPPQESPRRGFGYQA